MVPNIASLWPPKPLDIVDVLDYTKAIQEERTKRSAADKTQTDTNARQMCALAHTRSDNARAA